jgi:hypothetical protein
MYFTFALSGEQLFGLDGHTKIKQCLQATLHIITIHFYLPIVNDKTPSSVVPILGR